MPRVGKYKDLISIENIYKNTKSSFINGLGNYSGIVSHAAFYNNKAD